MVIPHGLEGKCVVCRLGSEAFQSRLTTSYVDLAPGPHVLAVALPDVDLSAGLVMIRGFSA
jgi:hypothetical protein